MLQPVIMHFTALICIYHVGVHDLCGGRSRVFVRSEYPRGFHGHAIVIWILKSHRGCGG